jgi:signal transduction histidine kinase
MNTRWRVLGWPARWWARQSLRGRITLIATALFSVAVGTGGVLAIELQRYALIRVLDSSAQTSASDVANELKDHPRLQTVLPTTGGVTAVQVVNAHDVVVAASPGADRAAPVLNQEDLEAARHGQRFDINNPATGLRERVLAQRAGNLTVLIVTDLTRVDDSIGVITRVALIGGPIAVLLMGFATYLVAALTLRPVAALRHGAANITAAGLAEERLPVPGARDEIHRLAVTLNQMLDRIDSSTQRQRTFVGDAAHELRSPLASLRVQLEVAQRMGPESDWEVFLDDVLEDVARLDRLVKDLLSLARTDEQASAQRREPVLLDSLVAAVAESYPHARVPVRVEDSEPVELLGDPDALRRVVVNLVDNAIRYARTEVRVSVCAVREGGRDAVALTVTDDGPGIPAAERERVFDRFYRVEMSRSRQSGGTGLGLAIVRDLVRAHGGSVTLQPRPDGKDGLVASVLLPVKPAPA